MPSSLSAPRLIVIALAVALAPPSTVFGEPPVTSASQVTLTARDGQTTTIPIASESQSGNLPVIVEFSLPRGAQETPSRMRDAHRETMRQFRADILRVRVGSDSAGLVPLKITREFSRVLSGAAVSLSRESLAAVARLPYVRQIHRDVRVRATSEPAAAAMEMPAAWHVDGTTGAGIRVAIIDTGIDYSHPALGGGLGPQFKVIGGYDFVNNDDDPRDDHGHGTHVAGIVAANAPDLTGVAPEASLLALKALDAGGEGKTSDVIAAIERALDPNGDGDPSDRAHIINLSLSAPGGPEDALSRAVDAAVAAGVVVCAAAGNSGLVLGIGSPGTSESAITVGASQGTQQIAPFSARGPNTRTYGVKPDIVAPGVSIRSTALGGGTTLMSGTSMASPHVAGVAALLLELHPDWTPAHVKSALVSTATRLPVSVMESGGGRVDAVRAADATAFLAPANLNFGVTDGTTAHWTQTRTLTVTNRSAVSRSFSITSGPLPAGVLLVVSPPTILVPPGQDGTVALTLTVDHATVPFSADFASGGLLEIAEDAGTLHVPWSFVKGLRLSMSFEGIVWAALLSDPASGRLEFPMVGNDLYETLVIPGVYDMVLVGDAESRGTSFIAREKEAIASDRHVRFTAADAPHHLTFRGLDETATPLAPEIGRSCFGHRALILPESAVITRVQVFMEQPQTEIWSSPLSPRYATYGGDICRSDDLLRMHVLHYDSVRGVSADLERTAGGSTLHAQPVSLHFPKHVEGTRTLLLAGANYVQNSREDFAFAEQWSADVWNGTVYFEPSADLEAQTFPALEAQTLDAGRLTRTSPAPLRVVGNRGASYKPIGPPPPTTYLWPLGEPVAFGNGIGVPLINYWAYSPLKFWVEVTFAGPLGETSVPGASASLVLRDDRGAEISRTRESISVADLTRPLQLSIVIEGAYWLESVKGTASVFAQFGGVAEDSVPPMVTSLRVLDGTGKASTHLSPSSPARIVVSAIDTQPGIVPARIRDGSLEVSYRRLGTSEWRALPTTLEGEDYGSMTELRRAAYGTIVSASLADATSGPPGPCEIKVSVEDLEGNRSETTLSPAFIVSGTPRRRAVGK